ncbi:hypothetical protein GE21DRAFT_8465 [Neurospora crassa]|uniref:Uncharacterized protein n=2 Tax=Neurospora crassa TaxID=5141 RepID=Q1K5T4_NEUCR|nr:hypothetical protein NCU07215 [Neurospora crassa OR74A]EAA28204.1 hypothetical protein NCU07215 [Neurospora crassa OR74A]KHE85753.1 hypothetical protein GE21DRAFT_8465 [Neurospora crassa]CAD71067.1 conserved hypothetical protein [Neurospora crassa]|eukprot:XP_957440.1 hypothetical protein NCU07215 [Neurospora crassa OR74A]
MAEDTKTNDEAMEDLVQYLEKTYPKPHDWALDLSIFFKALAMKHFNSMAYVEDGEVTFKSLIKILKELSTDCGSNMTMAIFTTILRQVFPTYAQDVKASVLNFETNGAYTLCITEDTPTSALSNLTLNGKCPATITISVQKKDDTTASVKDNSDAKLEGL